MTNKEFIKHLAYHERVMRELHGVKVAMPFKVALEAARAATFEKNESPAEERA